MTKPLVSIVVPCYNEEEVISETYRRLSALALSQSGYEFEIVFIDDGSRDRTLELLRAMSAEDERVKIVVFSRNFGHQLAVTAGMDEASGDAVVIIDADLQDPPDVIPEMLAKWNQGYAVVYGVRTERRGESSFKRLTAHLFYRLLNALSDTPIPLDTGDFRLVDRAVVNTLGTMNERDRFIRGMVSWVGFKQFPLGYQREQRFAGTTKYPLRKMLRFASDGVISFSTKPLRVAMLSGVASAGLACIGIIWALAVRLFDKGTVPGWAATIIAVLFLGGVQLVCTGILGEYVGRIYMQSKDRPLYIVSERLGSAHDSAKPKQRGSRTDQDQADIAAR